VFFIAKPDQACIQSILENQRSSGFSYAALGATREERFPNGFRVDRNAIRLGTGEAVFAEAQRRLKAWQMMDLGWLQALPASPTPVAGMEVALLIRHFRFWSVNVSRIVYVLETPNCYGFAYGTLAEHAESGEERFTVTRRTGGDIWYEIVAFSRARHPLARLGYPLTRALQKRFARDSLKRMQCGQA
jgi:uncharacterized protein (UPF0548 family)